MNNFDYQNQAPMIEPVFTILETSQASQVIAALAASSQKESVSEFEPP